MKRSQTTIVTLAVALIVCCVWRYWPVKPVTPPRAIVHAPPKPPPPVAAPLPGPMAPAVVYADRPAEAVATAQMYAAHVSLRQPEVIDPDSRSNRQILQTMVFKALAQPGAVTPSLATKP